jgi:aspartyl-tRNA(Asn)/glutamyl-tRNA(Gln) amidotransferase subunit B
MKKEAYTPTIGLEIHAELRTETKMFCGCKNAPHDSEPNIHVCPICVGHPGTLPMVNEQAVQHVLLVGRALEANLATFTEFDRKNYFYPDIPKGYQISQFAYPLVSKGSLAGVAITRVHLEEDTARSVHDKAAGSLIDYNRAGVPLMELVTEPVIHDAKTAGNFARELQLLLRTLGVSDANMERGEMRVEVNISVSASDSYGTKVEIKNLNSFRSVESAIAYEIDRQINLLEKGETIIQETRGWDEIGLKTVSQRKKESSHDYRYFPDPDIPKFSTQEVPTLALSRLDEIMPETPSKIRAKFLDLGLPNNIIEILVADRSSSKFYEQAITELEAVRASTTTDDKKKLVNFLTTDLLGAIAKEGTSIEQASPRNFAELIALFLEGVITTRVVKDLLYEISFGTVSPRIIVEERGLLQGASGTDLATLTDEVLRENQNVVEDYRKGKEAALQFLVGQLMKKTRGSADPSEVKAIILKKIM